MRCPRWKANERGLVRSGIPCSQTQVARLGLLQAKIFSSGDEDDPAAVTVVDPVCLSRAAAASRAVRRACTGPGPARTRGKTGVVRLPDPTAGRSTRIKSLGGGGPSGFVSATSSPCTGVPFRPPAIRSALHLSLLTCRWLLVAWRQNSRTARKTPKRCCRHPDGCRAVRETDSAQCCDSRVFTARRRELPVAGHVAAIPRAARQRAARFRSHSWITLHSDRGLRISHFGAFGDGDLTDCSAIHTTKTPTQTRERSVSPTM